MLTLISGGSRSGKSKLAVDLASKSRKNVVFCATAQALDDEMEQRIAIHKKQRPREWALIEEPLNVAKKIKDIHADNFLIIDCLTLYIANLLGKNCNDNSVLEKTMEVIEEINKNKLDTIIVTNEVGMSIVPENALARRFRDLAGRVNQEVAAAADCVYICFLGYPIKLK